MNSYVISLYSIIFSLFKNFKLLYIEVTRVVLPDFKGPVIAYCYKNKLSTILKDFFKLFFVFFNFQACENANLKFFSMYK